MAMVFLGNKMVVNYNFKALTSKENMIQLFIHAAPPVAAWTVRWR